MMTRNDFELLANALRSERVYIEKCRGGDTLSGFMTAVNAVAGVCAANNSRFDRKRFIAAIKKA